MPCFCRLWVISSMHHSGWLLYWLWLDSCLVFFLRRKRLSDYRWEINMQYMLYALGVFLCYVTFFFLYYRYPKDSPAVEVSGEMVIQFIDFESSYRSQFETGILRKSHLILNDHSEYFYISRWQKNALLKYFPKNIGNAEKTITLTLSVQPLLSGGYHVVRIKRIEPCYKRPIFRKWNSRSIG